MTAVSAATGFPALPNISTSIGSAIRSPPSSPEIPTAGIPAAPSTETSRLLALPERTIRTSSMIFLGRDAPAVDERRLTSELALKRGDFIASAVDDAERSRCGVPPVAHCLHETWVRLNSAAELDDYSHAGNPLVSFRPSMRFAFCTA